MVACITDLRLSRTDVPLKSYFIVSLSFLEAISSKAAEKGIEENAYIY